MTADLPRTSVGKLDKARLRREYAVDAGDVSA